VVATQPIHPRFIEKGFSEAFETWELEFVFRLSGSSLVDWQAMKIEFAGNKLFRDISMRETRVPVQLIEDTRCQRFGLNLQLKSKN
jgi:hypothetical protein